MHARNGRSPFNRKPRGFLAVEDSSTDEAKLMLYDEIGFWGVTAKDFIAQLDDISARTIHLHINSPGGDVFDGMAMANAIRSHSSRVITHVDGLAASIASIIAIAGDYVRMADNAFMMIHDPYMLAMGNATELRKGAELLDKIGGSIVGEYVKKTGKPIDEVKTMMNAETWFTSAEAKACGMCDAIDHAAKDDAPSDAPANAFDLSAYRKTPAALLQEPEGDPTIRELEAALRDAGCSRSEARLMVSAGLKAVKSPTTPRDVDAALATASRELLDAFRS